ncbi:MAG: mismatch-specific DNA-glycosylase [Beijerinckiaceae bacterium]|nr:mismatch-specific DNA-glycosylase [Beijerinckiaceae bacterium]
MGDVLEDLLADGLRIVFCGTRPGIASAERRAYYAKPGNRFWRTLHEVGLIPRLFAPEEYPLLLPLGIGLTDLAKSSAGQDSTLSAGELHLDRLRKSLERHQPRCLAFTSKNAAQLALGRRNLRFGLQDEPFCGIETHVLPSTSGLATSHWNVAPWQALARRAADERHHAAA